MKMLTIAVGLFLTSFATHAEWNKHFKHRNHDHRHNDTYFWQDIEHRQYRQGSLINNGVENGQLTRREAKLLYKEKKHIAKQIKHMKTHNHLSHHDKKEVLEHLDYVNGKIRTLSHNQYYVRKNDDHRHHNHNHNIYSSHRNRNVYQNNRNRLLTWANRDAKAGLYFRF